MIKPENQSVEDAAGEPSLPGACTPELSWVDSSTDTVTDRQLSVVRSRLAANLGSALASWFHIVPSDHASGELNTVALLLGLHLPILVPVNDLEAGPVFFVPRYDIDGRRLNHALDPEHLTAYSSLADALLAADMGFQALKAQTDLRKHGQYPRTTSVTAELPEERWLRHELAHCASLAEANA